MNKKGVHRFKFSLPLGVALVGISLCSISEGFSQTNYFTWNNSTNTWSTSTAWTPTGGPQNSGSTTNTNVAVFAATGIGNNSVLLGSDRTVFGLLFSNGANSYSIASFAVTGTNLPKQLDIMSSPGMGLTNNSSTNQIFNLVVQNNGNNGTWSTAAGATTTLIGGLNLTTSGSTASRTLTLAGAGNWNVGAIGNGGTATAGVINVTATGTTTFSGNNTYDGRTTMNGVGGTLTLSGDNSGATGGVTLTAGTLNINNNSALGTGPLSLAGTNSSGANTINNTSGSAVVNAGNQPWTWSDGLAFGSATNTVANNLDLGTGVVTASSGRTIALAGTGTKLTMGAVNITSASSGRTITANGAGNTLEMGGLTLSGNTTNAVTVTLAGTANLNISGAIVDGQAFANGVTVASTGTNTFSGNNTYTGVTTISAGTTILSGNNNLATGGLVVGGATGTTDKPVLRLNSVNAISSGSTISGASSTDRVGTLDFNAGTAYTLNSYSGGTMNFTNSFGQDSVVTFTNAANILTSSAGGTGGRSLQNNSANLDIVFNGSLDIGSSVTDTVNTIGGAGDFVVKGNIFSTTVGSVRGLNKTGAGLLEMQGANNSYNGNTTIFNGTLSVADGANLTGTSVRVAPSSGNSGTLLVNGTAGAVVVSARGIVRGGGSITSLQVQDAGTVEGAVGTTWTTGGTIDFAAGSKVLVTGTPTEASYTLVTASGGITGTPVLETAIPGYVLAVEGNSLVLRQQVARLTPTIIVTPSVGGYVYSGSIQGPGLNEVNNGGSTGTVTLNYAGTGSTTYGPSDIPPINAGTYTLTATVASDSSYNEASSTPTAFTIGKATPTVSVAPTASPVTVGALLSSSILSGGAASVAGTFAWTTPSTVLSASGPYPVTFNPTDSANYNTASTSASVTANPAGTTYSGWLSGGAASDAAFLDYVFGAATAGTLDPSLKPTVAVTSGSLVLTYNVRQGTLGLTVTAQSSSDLATGAAGWGTSGVTDVAVGTPRTVNGVSVQQRTASVSASGGKKFLRIQAVQAAP